MESKQEIDEKNEKTITTDEAKAEPHYRGVKAIPFIIGNEAFEKLGNLGATNNLLVYLTIVFNMDSITANTVVNIFSGTCNFASLPGAILVDTYFGRYRSLGFGSIAAFLGMLVLALTAAIPKLHPPHCEAMEGSKCSKATPWQLTVLMSGFGLMAIGAAGIRPSNLAFGADQFNPNTESGKKGINSFFNWYYFSFTVAMMLSMTIIVYLQSNVGWGWGLGVPAMLMFLSCALFFAGSRMYVKVKPEGSPLLSVIRVFVVAIKKRRLKLQEEPWLSLFNYIDNTSINSKLPHTEQFSFLDKAAILEPEDTINPDGSAANPWRLCSMQQVEEVKCVLRLLPIWISAIVFFNSMIQQTTYAVFQALQSQRHLGNSKFKIPAATYSVFAMLSLSIFIPTYDRIIVPILRRFTGIESGITLLQRIGCGLVLSILTMLVSGLVEGKRRTLALTNPIGTEPRRGAISPLSAFWLVPQMALIGVAEAFCVIGNIELFYKQFPENMRSISGSFLFIGMGLSSYLNGSFITIVHNITSGSSKGNWLPEDLNKGRLDYFYYLVAAIELVNLGYFLVCAKWYKYKGDMKLVKSEIV
ncbi:hypothetical protein UlMin_008136 [Ulmus minor]